MEVAAGNNGQVWIADAGAARAGSHAPLALWPGAGTGQGRDVLLRAHPLLDHGIVRSGVLGQQVIHGGVEARHWLQPGRASHWRLPRSSMSLAH